ncbi:hypothetical protein RJ639_045045, partial [Escallonia herrerae]
SLTTPQPNFAYYRCSVSGNYTTNCTYAANLKTTFLPSPMAPTSTLTASSMLPSDKNRTKFTLPESVEEIRQSPATPSASTTLVKPSPMHLLGLGFCCLSWSDTNATNPAQFDDVLGNLLFDLRERATPGTVRKYAADVDKANYTSFVTIYGLEQCTPDLSEMDCGTCLDMARNDIAFSASGKVGAFAVSYNCALRFETYQLFQPTADAPLPPLRSTPAPLALQSPPPLSADTILRARLVSYLHCFNKGNKAVDQKVRLTATIWGRRTDF